MLLKLVDSAHYHLWTDALHARSLAYQARNKWDRGTYVRWTIITAWTVFEIACEEALETHGIGRRFPDNLNNAISRKSLSSLDRSRGIWQQVLEVHKSRKKYVHVNISQKQLFPDTAEAENAIQVLRNAIKAIYSYVGKSHPSWIEDDFDRGWDDGSDPAHGTLTHQGVDVNDPFVIKITYIYKGREHISDIYPSGTDPAPYIRDFISKIRAPISAIRVYRGTQLIEEQQLQVRGT